MKSGAIHIRAGGTSVFIGGDVFSELKALLNSRYKGSGHFILVDENTRRFCLPELMTRVKVLADAEVIEIESGEENKNMAVCMRVWKALGETGADRRSLLINLGGGVISDLGGFAASVFKRGIDFVNIPTTLLSQVDASVGGKTGIDINNLKNEVGTFAEPQAVFIHPHFLESLNKRQVVSGYAEIIKHALIADAKYWKKIKATGPDDTRTLPALIIQSVEIKNRIVQSDPREKGPRKLLNFGHTIGHAVESYFLERAKTLYHGEAVAIGMVCEAYLSYKRAKLDHTDLDDITELLFTVFNPVKLEAFDDHRLVELMRHDKKNVKGEIRFTLLSRIGKAETDKTCSIELIKEAFRYYREQVNIRNT